jgi:hypothetical protein
MSLVQNEKLIARARGVWSHISIDRQWTFVEK